MSAATTVSNRRSQVSSALFLIFCLAAPVATSLPADAQPATEDKAVTGYRLTVAGLNKVIQATTDLTALYRSDAGLPRRMVEESRVMYEKYGEEVTLAQIAAGFDRHPPVRRVMATAGLTSTEYVTFTLALALTEVALVDSELGEKDPNLAPAIKANLAFRGRNKASLSRLEEQMEAMHREERKP